MQIQDALDTIDELIRCANSDHNSSMDMSCCTSPSFYEQANAAHAKFMGECAALREAVERGTIVY